MKLVVVPALALLVACGGKSSSPAGPGSPSDPSASRDPMAKAVGTPRTDLIPRQIIFGNPERVDAQLSPDGKYLSWTAPKDGVMNIWVAPLGKLDEAKVITAETTRPIREYTWAYTSKHLLYKQDIGGDENFHWFRADLADGKVTDLTPYKGALAELGGLSPKQPTKVVFLINDRDPKALDVHEIDLLTGKRTLIAQNDNLFSGFTLDHQMKPRFASKRLADGGIEIQKRDQDGKWATWDTIPIEDAETTGVKAFAPTGKAVYMIDSRGRDTAALVTMDLAGKKQKLLAEDPKADAAELVVHPTKHHVQAVAFDHQRIRWHVLDASIKKDLDALTRLDLGDVMIPSRTLDDKLWLVSTSSDQKPRRYHLWDRSKQKATFLFAARPALDQQPLLKQWPIEIASRDGLSLVSYLTLPAAADPDGDGKANTPVPMVLLVHGGPWLRDYWGFDPIHQMLGNRGYAVLSVNYRGSTGFGKKFLNAGNLQWGKAMHDDLIDAVGWAVKAGISPKDRICILGTSYGGYATLVGLAMTPDVFACGVDIVGVSNLHTFIATIPPYWAPELAAVYTRVGNPATPEGKALLTAISPLTHAAKIKRPLLIGQGANDPRVKQAESEQIVAAMKKARLPVTYVVFPDEGHGFYREVNTIAFYGVTEAFLSAHLGGAYQPVTAEELAATSMQIKDGRAGIPGL
ncbi:MAG TPA: S9 family peptidase [Kofleriaceae bacterium]